MLRVVDDKFETPEEHTLGEALQEVLELTGTKDLKGIAFVLIIEGDEVGHTCSNMTTIPDIVHSLELSKFRVLAEEVTGGQG